jgi:integrase
LNAFEQGATGTVDRGSAAAVGAAGILSGTLLKANGEDVKTVQELLRHANSRITLEVYTQAVTSNKRVAQSKVVRMMVPNPSETKDEVHP